jgi:hypothetical protein
MFALNQSMNFLILMACHQIRKGEPGFSCTYQYPPSYEIRRPRVNKYYMLSIYSDTVYLGHPMHDVRDTVVAWPVLQFLLL